MKSCSQATCIFKYSRYHQIPLQKGTFLHLFEQHIRNHCSNSPLKYIKLHSTLLFNSPNLQVRILYCIMFLVFSFFIYSDFLFILNARTEPSAFALDIISSHFLNLRPSLAKLPTPETPMRTELRTGILTVLGWQVSISGFFSLSKKHPIKLDEFNSGCD